MRTPRPLALGLVLVATTGGLAACGGGGGGDEDAYVKTYQENCTKIQTATKDLTALGSSLSGAGSNPDAAVAKVKTGFTKFLDTSDEAISALADADAPSKYSDFQDNFKGQADKFSDNLGKAKSDINGLKSAADLSKLSGILTSLGNVGGDSADLPADLKKAAPACEALGSSAAASGGATG